MHYNMYCSIYELYQYMDSCKRTGTHSAFRFWTCSWLMLHLPWSSISTSSFTSNSDYLHLAKFRFCSHGTFYTNCRPHHQLVFYTPLLWFKWYIWISFEISLHLSQLLINIAKILLLSVCLFSFPFFLFPSLPLYLYFT